MVVYVVLLVLAIVSLTSAFRPLISATRGSRSSGSFNRGFVTRSNQLAAASETISPEKIGAQFLESLNGTDVRVGIIRASWNKDIIDGLYEGVNASLTEAGVQSKNVFTTTVPGAFELPVTAKMLAASKRVDVIICLGCLIKGDTMHFEYRPELLVRQE